ncbi:nitrate- and nitrite sensing domain-containing protein, partial [Streptomyces sp. NPDC001759]
GGAGGAGATGGGGLGAGQGPRAALPGTGQGGNGRPGGSGGARGPQAPNAPQGRPAPAGAGAGFGQAPGAPQGLQATGQDSFGGARGAVPPQSQPQAPAENEGRGRRGRRPQLPGRGGPRAELPGGDTQPRTPSWSDENAQPPVPRASLDTPRGHDETSRMPRFDDHQGPGATTEMPAIGRGDDRQGLGPAADFDRPAFGNDQQNTGQFARPGMDSPQNTGQFARPGANGSQNPGEYPRQDYGVPQNGGAQGQGSFVRPDVFGSPNGQGQGGNPQNTGQYTSPSSFDAGSTGQFAVPGYDGSSTGQHSLPGRQNQSGNGQFERPQNGADFGAPRQPVPPRPQRPVRQEPEALPPATGPGDGRTPLYDTLETNWFHGGPGGEGRPGEANGSAPAQQQPQAAAPQRPATSSWRTSPNDDLVRQAERVRQPAAGGVTTSGLPRRVPRANLVPGTAQQQQHQTGPQVSRAPDDVRGRLTNLRRGIAQGRQAGTGTGQTGSFPSPTHQQER